LKIAVIGAGPAGLTFARLVKRSRPETNIVVYEQNPQSATYGFGVGLSGGLRSLLETYDEEVYRRIQAASLFDNRQLISVNGDAIELQYSEVGGAIRRLDLLTILQTACAAVGITVKYETRLENVDDLEDADLVIGADGVNSVVRAQHEEQFGTRTNRLKNHHAWYGVEAPLVPSGLAFKGQGSAAYVAHYYAYTSRLSTFVAECNDEAWQESGLEDMDSLGRKAFFEKLFENELQGQTLIDNRSYWRCFPVVTNENWTYKNIVLLGDALRSAHFSIGSGTRLAMEDAFALHDALKEAEYQVEKGLALFVEKRRPAREKFASAAEMSFNWYEDMAKKMSEPLPEFVHSFVTRTGRIDDARLGSYCPNFADMFRAYVQAKQAAA
jgi:2-polyprenyl-6-methoxyphenol hydroxylase-like FAD-dependent oxidoreductase